MSSPTIDQPSADENVMHESLYRAIATAKNTLDLAENLKQGRTVAGHELSMAPRQAQELSSFLAAFGGRLNKIAQEPDPSLGHIKEVIAFEYEVDRAYRFVDQAFLSPRSLGREQRALGVADWFCVEGFRLLVDDRHDGPVGPIVAIEASRSPAVWSEDSSLPIPSLLTPSPQVFSRRRQGDESSKKLGRFPLIFFPGNLVRSPADFCLLSHEVGHAADTAQNYTKAILLDVGREAPNFSFWRVWMREIVADAVGVLLSGEGYLLSFISFTRYLGLRERADSRSSYPGYTLRLHIMLKMLENLEAPHLEVLQSLVATIEDKESRYPELLESFNNDVWPKIETHIFATVCMSDWIASQEGIWQFGEYLRSNRDRDTGIGDLWRNTSSDNPPLRHLSSALAVVRHLDPERKDLYECFLRIYEAVYNDNRPGWMEDAAGWSFLEEDVPNLRPTILSEGGVKVPPEELLIDHDHIVFVAATNGQLKERLESAFEKRGRKPWAQLEFFFASDTLLKMTIREDMSCDQMRKERDDAKQAILGFIEQQSACVRAIAKEFDGPPTFGAYYDWEQPGGRIHISAQLSGIDIRHCPSTDYVWTGTEPTPTYRKLMESLETLRA